MARILISPQRHSDNFTTKQRVWVVVGGGCFLLPLREQLFCLCLVGPALGTRPGRPQTRCCNIHQTQVRLGSWKVNCSCLDKILKSCLWDSQALFYNRSSWQRNQEVLLSQDPRQVIVFPNCILISDGNGHFSFVHTFAHIYKLFVFTLSCWEKPDIPETRLQNVPPCP